MGLLTKFVLFCQSVLCVFGSPLRAFCSINYAADAAGGGKNGRQKNDILIESFTFHNKFRREKVTDHSLVNFFHC